MERKWDSHTQHEPLIGPRLHLEQGVLHGDGSQRLEHLHGDQDAERHGLGHGLGGGEDGAGIAHYVKALDVVGVEGAPGGALAPVGHLAEGDAVGQVPPDEGPHRGAAHVEAGEAVAGEHPAGHDGLVLGARRPVHGVRVRRVEAQGRGGGPVRHQVHPQQVQRGQRLGQAQHCAEEDGGDLAQVAGDEEADEALHVVVDAPALLHRIHNGGEVVVRQNHVRRLLGHLCAGDAHGDADGRLLQRGRVVDAVACHGGHLVQLGQHLHQLLLVRGLRAAEQQVARAQLLLLRLLGQLEEVPAHKGAVRHVLVRPEDVAVAGDGDGRVLGVARDHNHADARPGAHVDGLRHLRARGVLDAGEAHEREALLDARKVLGVVQQRVRGRVRATRLQVQIGERAQVLGLLDGQGQAAQRPRGHLRVLL
mmetsp:Transcript_32092/g.55853  ORF Transcript_32092/g.55853 Transcript_32092/m.55853 type:complete len:421 (-) Transcript_32092:271-1533(-)